MDETAVITWLVPSSEIGAPVSKYVLHVDPNPDSLIFEINDNSATYYNLTGLMPNTSYTVNVTSVAEFDGYSFSGTQDTIETISFMTIYGSEFETNKKKIIGYSII